jgi:hypothetical protein
MKIHPLTILAIVLQGAALTMSSMVAANAAPSWLAAVAGGVGFVGAAFAKLAPSLTATKGDQVV